MARNRTEQWQETEQHSGKKQNRTVARNGIRRAKGYSTGRSRGDESVGHGPPELAVDVRAHVQLRDDVGGGRHGHHNVLTGATQRSNDGRGRRRAQRRSRARERGERERERARRKKSDHMNEKKM